jgi:L-asparaginase II
MRIEQERGGFVETRHPVRAIAVARSKAIWDCGAMTRAPWRSAGKPFQLARSLAALEVTASDVPTHLLAIGASSHSGEPHHVAAVREVLRRFGAPEEGLLCGAEPPMHRPSADEIIRQGETAAPIHNDCSGKHAFMLAASMHRGWSSDYRTPDHPLQAEIAADIHSLTMEHPGIAIDGCGVPTFILTVTSMARAYAALALRMAEDPESDLGRIGWAMARHPELVSGTSRVGTAIASAATEPMVGKIGALGVFCIALPERGIGLAIKIESGDVDALACAIPAALEFAAPGSVDVPTDWPWHTVRNVVGEPVGQRVVFRRAKT